MRRPKILVLVAMALALVAVASAGGAAPGVVNLGVAGDPQPGDVVAIDVGEFSTGADLNGDGDLIDNVTHVYDGTATTNLRLASSVGLTGSLLAMTVFESAQGGTDRNGDGDGNDMVLAVHDGKTGTTTNLGLAVSLVLNDGRWIAFLVGEAAQAGTDLNGDGDVADMVLHLYDSVSRQVRNTGLAAPSGFSLVGGRVAIRVSESAQGASDLNNDGDTTDGVLHLYDAATGTTENVGLAAAPRVYDDGRFVSFAIPEVEQSARDLNGDGDTRDSVLHVLDTGNGSVANVGRAVSPSALQVAAGRVAFDVYEPHQSADLNGDGDQFDVVADVYEAATGTLRDLRLASGGFAVELDDTAAAFAVSESGQAGTDLNGDGDAADSVIHLLRTADGTITNTRLASNAPLSVRAGLIAALVNEEQQGADLNGDGDAADFVAHVIDVAAGSTRNLGLAGLSHVLGEGVAAVNVPESGQGGVDLNADGDANDAVIHVYDSSTQLLTNLGVATRLIRVSGKRFAFDVDEAGQAATDLNGDGDARDLVAHIFLAAAQPPPPPPAVVLGFGRAGELHVGVAAFSGRAGPRGTVTVRAGTRTLHLSRVTCLSTVGDHVLVGGVVVRSTSPGAIGSTSLLALRDGKAGVPDAIGSAFSRTGLDTCPAIELPLHTVTSGGFSVMPG